MSQNEPVDCKTCGFKSRFENGMVIQEVPQSGTLCPSCMEWQMRTLKGISEPKKETP